MNKGSFGLYVFTRYLSWLASTVSSLSRGNQMETALPRNDFQDLIQTTSVLEIVGDMIRVRATEAALGDLAVVENVDGAVSTARVVGLDRDVASLQVFTGGKGCRHEPRCASWVCRCRSTYSENILGRIFDGAGEPIDGRPHCPTIPASRWAVRQ